MDAQAKIHPCANGTFGPLTAFPAGLGYSSTAINSFTVGDCIRNSTQHRSR